MRLSFALGLIAFALVLLSFAYLDRPWSHAVYFTGAIPLTLCLAWWILRYGLWNLGCLLVRLVRTHTRKEATHG